MNLLWVVKIWPVVFLQTSAILFLRPFGAAFSNRDS
jgi:hypothetical protein